MGEWRAFYELLNVYRPPVVIRGTKQIKMRWADHIACVREKINVCNVLARKHERKSHLEDLGTDGRIILK
jgi:hypothetical protein